MAVVLRYVDKKGCVMERFVGVDHIRDTTSISLKAALDNFFSKHDLSMMRLRGQGYDGTSNMRGEFNGLKSLILKDNKYAYYVHFFAHQLQLASVAVEKNHVLVALLFNTIISTINIVAISCRRHDILRDTQAVDIAEKLKSGEITSGKGQNQETSLKRAGDTCWGSYHATILSLIRMFPYVIKMLEIVVKEGSSSEQKGEAYALLGSVESFDFILRLHLMRNFLGITNELSKTLQEEDQDIVNAMHLVGLSKERLQDMRDKGWDSLLSKVSSFCGKHEINVPEINDNFIPPGQSRRRAEVITNLYHYRVELFYTCIDMQLQELDNRFSEANTELLLCMACLSPRDKFSAFNREKLIRLTEFYKADIIDIDRMVLHDQLETYIIDFCYDDEFHGLNGIRDLSEKMVDTRRNLVYPLVFPILTLSLIIPVATATVEREFSAMHIVKNCLRNRMGDELLNDSMVTYIEKDIFISIDGETIMQRFQNMAPCRGQLDPSS